MYKGMSSKTPMIDNMTDKKLTPEIISITPAPVAREPNCGFNFNKAIPVGILTAPEITTAKVWIKILSKLGEIKVRAE